MLYDPDGQQTTNKYQDLPLRVDQDTIRSVVERAPLRCSHFDAFRFFTEAARPQNIHSFAASREDQAVHEQPACVHANMDLLRIALKLLPLIPSDHVLHALRIALRARRVDMRASPYDLSSSEDP